jgi:glycine cleavage system H protein
MSGDLIFMMGKFEAKLPTDRRYAKNHMWAKPCDAEPTSARETPLWRFGFSAYAVRLLQDVYFLDWTIDAGTVLKERQAIGNIESSKAESELYAPVAGMLIEFNLQLLTDPSAINVNTYAPGWLFAMESNGDSLISPEQYVTHLETAWKVAERTIKGQLNE